MQMSLHANTTGDRAARAKYAAPNPQICPKTGSSWRGKSASSTSTIEGAITPTTESPNGTRRNRGILNLAPSKCSGTSSTATSPSPPSLYDGSSSSPEDCDPVTPPRRQPAPRQQSVLWNHPDRFIPARACTPTKQSLLLTPSRTRSSPADPFGPARSRGTHHNDRFVTQCRLPPTPRSGLSPTPMGLPPDRRTASTGAVWTVGGTIVTEGVASIPNGRGGRVTSGTNAPHYTSNFLHRHTPSQDQETHADRLALAMNVVTPDSMFADSSPLSSLSPCSPRRRSQSDSGRPSTRWNNNAWEIDGVCQSPTRSPKRKLREIPIVPFRVLDAPALRDDYYCSLLAYSATLHCLAVGLGSHVYLWSEARGTIPTHMPDSLTAPFGAHVTSLSFSSTEGGHAILAVGRADGRVTLWSPQDAESRFDSEQPAPVACVCFRPNAVRRTSVKEPGMTVMTEELLVGDEVGHVYYYSVEWPTPDQRDLFGWHGSMTLIARFSCHSQQVCGVAWSRDGEYFATGGNDNHLYLFETRRLFPRLGGSNARLAPTSDINVINGNSMSGGDPLLGQSHVAAIGAGQQKHLFALNAAVKAIAFAPWQTSLVAAGGGSNDRCVHFFHAVSGAKLATIDCHAQVTSLVWSDTRREIAVTFGFAQPEHPYRVAVFAWPSCTRVVGIPWWGEERALWAVGYPGGPNTGRDGRQKGKAEGCLVVATSDASIKFHEVWGEKSRGDGGGRGLLGGSRILEDAVSEAVEDAGRIR